MVIVLFQQRYIELAQMSHDARAALVRRPCGDRMMAL